MWIRPREAPAAQHLVAAGEAREVRLGVPHAQRGADVPADPAEAQDAEARQSRAREGASFCAHGHVCGDRQGHLLCVAPTRRDARASAKRSGGR